MLKITPVFKLKVTILTPKRAALEKANHFPNETKSWLKKVLE